MAVDDTPFDPHHELLWLSQALVGHLQWASATGSDGVPAVDAAWLERRREQYRALQLTEEELTEWSQHTGRPAPSSESSTPTEQQQTVDTAASPMRDRAASPTVAQPAQGSPAEPNREAKLRDEPNREAKLRDEPAIPIAARVMASTASLPNDVAVEPLRRSLPQLEAEVRTCTRCALHEGRTNTVFARGTGKSGICFVGEGPGQDEDLQGAPFVGKAGQLLDRMIAAMGLERDDVYVCNIVKCRPPKNRKPLPPEMEACRPFLLEQLDAVQPKVIVALGATAVEGLLGLSMGITRLRGQWRLYRGSIPVMPTFHPAYLLRQPAAKREVWSDLQQVLQHLGMTVPPRG